MDLELSYLKVNGWCVVGGGIPEGEVGRVRESVLETVERHRRPASDGGIGFVPGVIAQDQSFAPYLADDRLMGVVRGALGDHVRVSFTSAIVNLPGNVRGGWHADWPFNQHNAGHIPAPYPDAVMHLTTLWMLSPFTAENGGTLILPGSHRASNNPTGDNGMHPDDALPGEMQVTGGAGDVLVMDSRLWHATAPNRTESPRAALAVRYAPWWLNTAVLRPGSDERMRMVVEAGKKENEVPAVPRRVYDALPDGVKPLYRHWVEAG